MELSEIVHSAIPGRATCQFDSSAESNPIGQTKPGGTGIIIVGPMTGQLEPQGKGGDSMGRWSYTTFRRQGVPPITIISVYQVCKEPTNVIGFTAWHQQKRALDIAGRNIHPRTAFIDDLCKVVTTFQAKQHAIIVGGDFNECMDDTRSGLLRLATTTGLTDPWSTFKPNYPEFATRDPGSKRIDSVLVSPSIYDSIISMGYAPVARFVDSDHRGICLEFTGDRLLGPQSDVFPRPDYRGVKSTDKGKVTAFIEAWYTHLESNSVFSKIDPMNQS